MCGIFGQLNFDGQPVDRGHLETLARHMYHRGPDGEGFWENGPVGLGMRRLSIIDLHTGQQPIANETGDVIVVCNGEIYNYLELRKELEARGHAFATESDVEVLVHLYEEFGIEAIHHLNGMFAFAIWDVKKQALWMARDRLGIKPLFISYNPNGLSFSSDLNSLRIAENCSLSLEALTSYLGYSYFPLQVTPYRNVERLLPAEEIWVENGTINKRRYWQVPSPQSTNISREEAKCRIFELFEDAVRLELRSDVPVGLFLSGGVDSSAVASLTRGFDTVAPLQAFTGDFVGKGGEDLRFAEEMAHRLGVPLNRISITANDQFIALEELIPFLDEPMSDSALVPTYIISRAAREQGIKVMLSGAGGDELFGGYPRQLPIRFGTPEWFASLPQPLRAIAIRILGLKNPAWRYRLATPARNFAVAISGANFAFLGDALRDKSRLAPLYQSFEAIFYDIESSCAARMQADLKNYLPDNILSLTDKATMATSIEGRVPFLDHRLVELAASLPDELIFNGPTPKALLGDALGDRLPQSILRRKKEGFNAPIHSWVSEHPQRIAESLLKDASPVIIDLVDMDVVGAWLADAGLRRAGGDSLYALFVLNLWLKAHH